MPGPASMPWSHRFGWPPRHGAQAPQAIIGNTATRSPACQAPASGPSSAMTPVNSWPSTCPAGKYSAGSSGRCRSEPQIPQYRTSTSTSPGPGTGRSIRTACRRRSAAIATALMGRRLRSEPVRGGAEGLTLGVGEHPGRRDREDEGLALAVVAPEGAAAGDPLPPPVPLAGERRGGPCEHGVVGNAHRVALDHDVQAPVPLGTAGGQHHVRVGPQVEELLLAFPGGEPDRPLGPRGDHRRDVRPAVGPHGGDPEQLGGLQRLAGLVPARGGGGGVAVALVELGDGRGHRRLSCPGAPGGPPPGRPARGARLIGPARDSRKTRLAAARPGGTVRAVIIREATDEDWPRIYPFYAAIMGEGRTYPFPEHQTLEEARPWWMEERPGQTVVAVSDDAIAGSAKRGPNRPGRGAHVATASFLVDPARQGQGTGRALGEYVLDWCRAAGFASIQFNAVVESNAPAVHLWQSLGFEIIGTVPESFDHPEHGLVGLHVMFRRL